MLLLGVFISIGILALVPQTSAVEYSSGTQQIMEKYQEHEQLIKKVLSDGTDIDISLAKLAQLIVMIPILIILWAIATLTGVTDQFPQIPDCPFVPPPA